MIFKSKKKQFFFNPIRYKIIYMKKKLLILELNECDFDFFLYGAKKYNYPLIEKLISNKKKIDTFTKDKHEGFNLDPWVQWISVHTGIPSKEHKTYRLGQILDKSIKQIWETLSSKKISCTVWGAFNSTLNKKKNIDLFFPDPWSFNEKAFPDYFNSFLKLPRYYAKNYPYVNKFKIIFYGLIFFYKIIFSRFLINIIKILPNLTKFFLESKLKSFNLYFFLDLISLLILKKNLKKKKSELVIIALNSFAHYQHNYWDIKKYEHIYFWYLNQMIKIINEIEKDYNSSIILNGFSQKKIKNQFHLRPKKPKSFFKKLNISFKNIEPDMTTGAIVSFKDFKDKNKAIKKINSLRIYSYPVFDVQDFKDEKKIYYKFSVIFLKKYEIKALDKKNYKIYFKKPKKLLKEKNISKVQKIFLDYIFKNSFFIKSTSRHISKGILFYKNVKLLRNNINKKQIENTKIYNMVYNHFN